MGELCPNCGQEYQRLAMHWNRSSCDYAQFTDRQNQILCGLLMGDADLHGRSDTNPHLRVRMTSREFLEFIDSELGILSKGIFLDRSASEQHETAKQNQRDDMDGFEVVNEDKYNDLHGLRTCSHPALNHFRRWYDGSEKRFPSDLELSPLIAKMWYSCDGWLAVEENAGSRVMFKVTNESERPEFLVSLFERAGFDVGFSRHSVQIPHHETVEFLDWMGFPPPGFEYKWDLSR